MQGEFSVSVLDSMAGVGAALEADDHVRLGGQHIGDLTLAFVAPIGAHYCFYHWYPPIPPLRPAEFFRAENVQALQPVHSQLLHYTHIPL